MKVSGELHVLEKFTPRIGVLTHLDGRPSVLDMVIAA
jgi:hypothetical protein